MKTLDIRPDLDLAPAKTTLSAIAGKMAVRLFTLFRAFRNRRAVMNLEDFTDQQLADIGLTRGDLAASLSKPWYEDPSPHLSRAARSNGLRRF